MVSAIVAVAKNGVIGNSGELPWYLPADLRRFKELTTGHAVIMGRTTYDSIVARLGHGLPNRHNIVLTRSTELQNKNGELDSTDIVSTIKDALTIATGEAPFIIGGAQIYELAGSLIDRWYITEIDTEIEGDVVLKGFNPALFKEVVRESHQSDDKNPYNYSFVTYERI